MNTLVDANTVAWSAVSTAGRKWIVSDVARRISEMKHEEIMGHVHDYIIMLNGAGDVVGFRLDMIGLADQFGIPAHRIWFDVDYWGDAFITVKTLVDEDYEGVSVLVECDENRSSIFEHMCELHYGE